MTRRRRSGYLLHMRMVFSTTILGLLAFGTGQAQTAADDAYFCEVVDGVHGTAYFSAAFLGDLRKDGIYAKAFRDHILASYEGSTGAVQCRVPSTDQGDPHSLSVARALRDDYAARARHATPPYKVVITDWTY